MGRALTGDEIIPLLLQRDTEHRHPAYPVAHHVEVLAGGDAPLHVVRQVEVGIVEQRCGFPRIDLRRGQVETGKQQRDP